MLTAHVLVCTNVSSDLIQFARAGATHLLQQTLSYDQTIHTGRWASIRAARLQDGLAHLPLLALNERSKYQSGLLFLPHPPDATR